MMTDQPLTLVFDWGDTLMKVFPQYAGAMLDWPEVAAVEGAPEALAALDGRCTLLVGTNAANSNAGQIRAALEKVGIGRYFQTIYTYHELGHRKPEPGFFYAIQRLAGTRPDRLVMVGDDYGADISGAWQAGWRTIWLNPAAKTAPGLLPLQTTEIQSMSELPQALERLDLPDVRACLAWMAQSGTSAGLMAHVQAVAAAAYQMAVWLRAAGEAVDPLLAHRGGLLHDLAKLVPADAGGEKLDHGERAARMLAERGQPALAEIARRHMMNRLAEGEAAPRAWEEKLVYFADKIIEGSSVVTFEERLESLHRRYPQHAGGYGAIAPRVVALRAGLCARFGFAEEELTARLRQAFRGI